MFDPKGSSTIGYHLFFEPEKAIFDELSSTIASLAKETGGPVFSPHAILLARIEGDEDVVVEKSAELSKSMHPFSISLGEIGSEDSFFRALYYRVQNAEELEGYHTEAGEVFGMKDEFPYMPHISLAYENFPPEHRLKLPFSIAPLQNRSFMVSHLYLYRTEGEVQEWKKIHRFPLGRI